jgi:hypothetical protein
VLSARQRFGKAVCLDDVEKPYASPGLDGPTIGVIWTRPPRHSPTGEVDIGINSVSLDEKLADAHPS